jgi:hypothetical protein
VYSSHPDPCLEVFGGYISILGVTIFSSTLGSRMPTH